MARSWGRCRRSSSTTAPGGSLTASRLAPTTTVAVPLLLNHMFGERRLHKCEANVWAFNAPSLALHRKLGFTEEGRLRDHEFLAGRHHDVVLFGMTAPEFAARHPFPSEI